MGIIYGDTTETGLLRNNKMSFCFSISMAEKYTFIYAAASGIILCFYSAVIKFIPICLELKIHYFICISQTTNEVQSAL